MPRAPTPRRSSGKGDLVAACGEPRQRVEAFRRLLRATGRLAGRQPGKGSGILDIAALLEADLPDPGALRRSAEDHAKHHREDPGRTPRDGKVQDDAAARRQPPPEIG